MGRSVGQDGELGCEPVAWPGQITNHTGVEMMGRKKLRRCGSRFTLTEGFGSQAETHWHRAAKTLEWLFQSGSFFTVGSTVMFPFLCHLPSFPLGFYILLLAWYLPSPSVQRIPLSSFSWLTNEMLNLAMLLSLSFIAQLHFLHFTCHSSVITLLLLYLLLYAFHLIGISSFDCYSSLLSFPCPLLPNSPPPPTSFRFVLPSSPPSTSLSKSK